MADLFYLQDSRNYVGNDMLFWCPGGAGYTTDLRKAATYAREEAQVKHDSRATDIPWPKDYIDARTRPAGDMQYVKRDEALADTGITITPEKVARDPQPRCQGCEIFLSINQYWGGYCLKCGTNNMP